MLPWSMKMFPGTNLQDLNLDWILRKVAALRGGSTGQYLYKKSDKDFDFGWKTGGGGGGGTSDYLDLDNKPTINNVELVGNKTASDLGLYVKPAEGIPETDLSSSVRVSLSNADSALQAVPPTYRTAAAQDAIDAAQDSKIETIVHRNFLDNWYFIQNGGLPVNQRGQNQYSTAGAFAIDRWQLITGTVELTEEGLILNGTIQQTIKETVNQPYAATVLTASGVVNASFNPSTKVFSITSDGNVAIKAAKLESGSYQTLGHQVGTDWAPNVIPKYSEELAKCQRYFVRLKPGDTYGAYGLAIAANDHAATILIYLPTAMSGANKAISYSGNLRLSANSVVSGLSIAGLAGNIATVAIATSNLTYSNIYMLSNNNDAAAYIDISSN